jgi:hypothetical protein
MARSRWCIQCWVRRRRTSFISGRNTATSSFRKGQNAIFVIEAELPLSSLAQWFKSIFTGEPDPVLPKPTPEVYIGPMPWEFRSVKDLGVFPVFDRGGIYRWVQLVECRDLK